MLAVSRSIIPPPRKSKGTWRIKIHLGNLYFFYWLRFFIGFIGLINLRRLSTTVTTINLLFHDELLYVIIIIVNIRIILRVARNNKFPKCSLKIEQNFT